MLKESVPFKVYPLIYGNVEVTKKFKVFFVYNKVTFETKPIYVLSVHVYHYL